MGRFASIHFSVLASAGVLLLSACGGGGGGDGTTTGGTGGNTPVFTSFTATPGSVPLNGVATLSWATTGEDSGNVAPCTATETSNTDGWTGSKSGSGSFTTSPLTPGGTHTFTLTCTNTSGSKSQSTSVSVAGSPLPTINTFVANPAAVEQFDFTSLSWSTSNATACTGSSNQPDWTSGTPATSGVVGSNGTAGNSVKVTPVAPGTTYTLNCTGPGGSASKSVLVPIVATAGPSVNITANPAQLTPNTNGTSTLSWQTANATTCEASGGDGTADWQGTQPNSGSATVGPLNSAGAFSYILTCSNANGTGADTAVVTVGTPTAPTVTITLNPSSITTGKSSSIVWSTANASSCVAFGNWSGDKPTASGSAGFSTGVITAVGTYTYGLTCTGPTGETGSSSATLSVSQGLVALDCGIGVSPTTAIIAANGATAVGGTAGTGVCLGCGVTNPSNVVAKQSGSSLTTTFATMATPINLLNGAVTLTVAGGGPVFPAGHPAGFLISPAPPSVLTLSLLQGVSVQTFRNGIPQDFVANASTVIPTNLPIPGLPTGTGGLGGLPIGSLPGGLPLGVTTSPLVIDLLDAVGTNAITFFGIPVTTQPFDSIEIITSDTLSLLGNVNVYAACAGGS